MTYGSAWGQKASLEWIGHEYDDWIATGRYGHDYVVRRESGDPERWKVTTTGPAASTVEESRDAAMRRCQAWDDSDNLPDEFDSDAPIIVMNEFIDLLRRHTITSCVIDPDSGDPAPSIRDPYKDMTDYPVDENHPVLCGDEGYMFSQKRIETLCAEAVTLLGEGHPYQSRDRHRKCGHDDYGPSFGE
jgi:hypothetical protein